MIPRMSSYAVTWQHGDQEERSGRLELVPRGLAFEGAGATGVASETIDIGDLREVRVARSPADGSRAVNPRARTAYRGSRSASRASSSRASSRSSQSILRPNSERST